MYDRLHDTEDDEHVVLWIRLKHKKLPRKYSLRKYLITSLDAVLRRSPDCGVILSVDFNQFND